MCGEVKPLADFIVTSANPRSRHHHPRATRCKACHLKAKRDARRARGLRRPDPRSEETVAATIARRVLAADIERWVSACGLARLPSAGSIFTGEEVRLLADAEGVTPSAARWRLKYEHDPEFRARQIERTHRRNARRDHRLTLVADGTLTGETVRRLFAEATACHYCARPMASRDKSLDHVTPVSQGGTHTLDNVVIACKRCNTAKAGRTPEQWRAGVVVRRAKGRGLRGADAAA